MAMKIVNTGSKQISKVAFYMEAVVTLSGGSLEIQTHLTDHMEARGFHGSTVVRLLDKNGITLYTAVAGPYGVEGTSKIIQFVSGGRSERRLTEHYSINPNIAAETDQINVWIGETPRNTFGPWLRDHWTDIVAVLNAVFGGTKSASDAPPGAIETSASGLFIAPGAETERARKKLHR